MEIRWLGRGPLLLSHTHRSVEQGALEGGRAMAIIEKKTSEDGQQGGPDESSEAERELAERQCWTRRLVRARNAPRHKNVRRCNYNRNRVG